MTAAAPRERLSEGRADDGRRRHRGIGHRAVTRTVTLALAVGFAVVGLAAAASAHHNTITGKATCVEAGGWTVTWTVVNSENIPETITASNRAVVPANTTQLTANQTRTFTETVTTKPTAPLRLTLTGKWVRDGQAIYATNYDDIAVSEFSDSCHVTTVTAPSVPVIDDCGPGNARFGDVPAGPWTSRLNADGSLTITANTGYSFPNRQKSVTYPAPVDSNVACPTPPTPPVVTPPVVTPPVTTPPEVLPAQVLVVRAGARRIDKCGRQGDLFKVSKRSGVVYTAQGKVLRQGVWLKARTRMITVRASAVDATYRLQGTSVWKLSFTRKACANAPEVAPNTGS